MWVNEVSVDVQAPAAAVYNRLQDFTRHGDFAPSLVEIEMTTPGPVSVGSEFVASETVPSRFTSYSRVTALEEPTRIAWESTDRRVMRVLWEFVLKDRDGGSRTLPNDPGGFPRTSPASSSSPWFESAGSRTKTGAPWNGSR